MPRRPIAPGPAPPSRLGSLLRHRRGQLGLSVRETARRAGISPSYLVSLEQGRNPSTGRAPIPTPPVIAAIGRVLGIELAALLDVTGAPAPRSGHVLLYQTGAAALPALDGARRICAGRVDAWIEVAAARMPKGGPADDVALSTRGPLGLVPSRPPRYEPGRALEALGEVLAETPPRWHGSRIGLLFGANSALLRSAGNPAALITGEATWEGDVAATCRATLGAEPAANVCVYRDADILALAGRIDPLSAVVSLVGSHPHVGVQHPDGSLVTGPAAVETILAAARPPAIGADTWASLARAAASGFARAPSAAVA
jgi:transcriptional regulator with XRE-family HTH domain